MALHSTVSGKVELAPLNKTNPLQQWKRVDTQQVGTWFESGIQNRLNGCLRSDGTNTTGFGSLKVGICAGDRFGLDQALVAPLGLETPAPRRCRATSS